MIWNPGDDTDLNEGGTDTDTVEVIGGNGAEQFTTTANGARVRFDRVIPAPFSIDIGTSENLLLNANAGDDTVSATGNLAALITITTDGGPGNDTLLGSNGVDLLLGGDGNDVVDGNQGNDMALIGAGDDIFQWDPGDGSDVVEGQAGTDTMVFNGSGASESIDISANGGRVRLFRNVANVTMDVNDLEAIDVNAFGGADTVVLADTSGTDLARVDANLAAAGGGGGGGGGEDQQADSVVVNATQDADVVVINGSTGSADVLLGGPGADILDGGDGDDIEIEIDGVDAARLATDSSDQGWLATHASTVDGKTVLDLGARTVTLPQAQLSQL